jgi:hypothetical protein
LVKIPIVSHPQSSRRTGLAVLAVLVASLPPGQARATDPAPSAAEAPLVVVGDKTVGDTTVIVVQQAPTPSRERPAWAYPERGLTFFPDGPGPGKERWSVGGIWQIAPMFTATYMRGLGAGFSVDARLQTIILFNQLNVGGQWAFQAGPISLGVMAHVGGFFGTLGKLFVATSEFDAIGWGIQLIPGAQAGIQIAKNSWLTLQYEAYLSLYQATKLGTLTVSPDAASYAGFAVSLVMEYSPKKEGVIYYGVALFNTAANYPIWFNVETRGSSETFASQRIWYVGLLAGYEF